MNINENELLVIELYSLDQCTSIMNAIEINDIIEYIKICRSNLPGA